MKKKYFLNVKTHRYHINGYCRHSKSLPDEIVWCDTEDEILAIDGRAAGFCKICQKKQNEVLTEYRSEKNG